MLAGGASLIAATDRGVQVRYDPFQEDGYTVHGASSLSLDTALPRAAMRAIHMPEECVAHLCADLSELYVEEGAKKLGLGSSAASTIASMLAIKPALLDTRRELFEAAFLAHRDIQRGRGSGADVAASTFGEITGYWLHTPQAPFACVSEPPSLPGASIVERCEGATILPSLKLPEQLRLEAIWLGAPASSTELIGRVEEAYANQEKRSRLDELFQQISDLALRALTMMQREDGVTKAWLDCAREGARQMRALGALSGAPIITPLHDELEHIARRHGAVCKPSGAGGGDFSILWGARDGLDWDALLTNLPPGTRHIPMKIGASENKPLLPG